MKCPKCTTNHPYRTGMTCKCGYRFSLDPKKLGMADGSFLALVKKCSASGTYHFTRNQLHAAYLRQKPLGRKSCAITLLGASVFVTVILLLVLFDGNKNDFRGLAIIVPIIVVLPILAWIVMYVLPVYDSFEKVMKATQTGDLSKSLGNLVDKPMLFEKPPEWNEQDIHDYGVERVLIVEHELNVDWLVRNNFHSAQRVLVISESGYPNYLLPVVQELLRERSDLPVFLLHDATDAGAQMLSRLRSDERFPLDQHPVIDLGLFKNDTSRIKKLSKVNEAYPRGTPLDTLPNLMLFAGLEVAFNDQVPLGALLERNAEADGGGNFG